MLAFEKSSLLKNIVKKQNKGVDTSVESHFSPDKSIVDMVDKMQRYVLPPHLDFLTFPDALYIPMYIFEFHMDFHL